MSRLRRKKGYDLNRGYLLLKLPMYTFSTMTWLRREKPHKKLRKLYITIRILYFFIIGYVKN